MVHPKGCRRLGQATPDTILEHPDCLFYLPIGLTVANSDVVIDDAQPYAEPYKATHQLGAIVGSSSASLPTLGSCPSQVFSLAGWTHPILVAQCMPTSTSLVWWEQKGKFYS